jgi:hypothetical protein
VRRAAAIVDVEPVWLGEGSDDIGPETAKHLGSRAVCGTVGTVDHDPQAVEPVRRRSDDVRDIPLETVGVVANPPDCRPCRTPPRLAQPRLDGVLDGVVELVSALREELDAVVRHGVVARGEHDAEVGADVDGQVGNRRRREDARSQHVDSGASESGDDGSLEELARRPGVASDDGDRPVSDEGARLGDDVGRRDRQVKGQLRGEVSVRQASDAVGSEETVHNASSQCRETRRPRSAAPGPVDSGQVSACCTAVPYEPS